MRVANSRLAFYGIDDDHSFVRKMPKSAGIIHNYGTATRCCTAYFDRNLNLNIIKSKARRYVYFGLELGSWPLDYFNILAFAFLESLTMHNAVKVTVSNQLPLTTSRAKDQGNPPSFNKNHIIAFLS